MADRPFHLNSRVVEIGESSLSSDNIPTTNLKSRPNQNSGYAGQQYLEVGEARPVLDADEIDSTERNSQTTCESNLNLPEAQSSLGNNLYSSLNNGDLNSSNLWEINYHEAAIFLEVCLDFRVDIHLANCTHYQTI